MLLLLELSVISLKRRQMFAEEERRATQIFKYNFCLWSGCLLAAILVGLTSKGRALICHCGTWLVGLQDEEARRHSVCQEEILPDTTEASPVFFQHKQRANAVNFPWHCMHMKTLLFTSYYCASKCSYTAKCHHYQFVLLAGWFYALSSFGKCFAGRYIFLSIKHS